MKRFPEEPVASIFFILLVQIFIVVCLFWGLINNLKELTFFSIIILVIGLVTYLWSRISINNVNCNITTDKTRLFPGEDLELNIHAVNTKFLPLLIKINLLVDRSITGADDESIIEKCGLLWYQRINFQKD